MLNIIHNPNIYTKPHPIIAHIVNDLKDLFTIYF